MWRRPSVAPRCRRSTGDASMRIWGKLSASNNHGSFRCIHSTCTRQTPNVHTLIAERLKQYVDPNSPKPTRTYAEALGTFNLSSAKHGNARSSTSRHENTLRDCLSADRRSAPRRGISLRERLSAERGFETSEDEHLYPVEPGRRKQDPRSRSESAGRHWNNSNAGSFSNDPPRKARKGAASASPGTNRFASAAKPSTSGQTVSALSDRMPDAFELNFAAARLDDSAMKPRNDKMDHFAQQRSPSERRAIAPEPVDETPAPADSKAKEPGLVKKTVPDQQTSANDREALRKQLTRGGTAPSLPNWDLVKRPRSISNMIDRLVHARFDSLPLYCHVVTDSHPHVMLIYATKGNLVFEVDLAKLGHNDAFLQGGYDHKDVTLGKLLRESADPLRFRGVRLFADLTHTLFFHDVRRTAGVVCGFHNIDLRGVCDVQVMQSMSHPAHGEKSLEDGVMAYLQETGQSLERYQRLLKERKTACEEYWKKDFRLQLKLAAVKNVFAYQMSLMPQMAEHYTAKLGGSVGKCLEESARRVEEARREYKEAAKAEQSGEKLEV